MQCQQSISLTVLAPNPCDGYTKVYKVDSYGPAVASNISSLFPSAPASALPEWDGVFRDDGSGGESHSECYAISGKDISLSIRLLTVKQDISCHISGFDPNGWVPDAGYIFPNKCYNFFPSFNGCALVFSGANAFIIDGSGGTDSIQLANLGTRVGLYRIWTSPATFSSVDCSSTVLGAAVQSYSLGSALFSLSVY